MSGRFGRWSVCWIRATGDVLECVGTIEKSKTRPERYRRDESRTKNVNRYLRSSGPKELRACLRKIGAKASEKEAKQILKRADLNGNGSPDPASYD